MSFDTLAWAGKQRCDKPAAKLVLLALASCAGADHCAYPSTAWLVDFTGLDRKTVIAACDRLQASGAIADTGERKGQTKQIKVYRLAAASVPETELFPKRNPPVFPSEGSQKRDTELVREPVPQKATPSSVQRARKPVPIFVLPSDIPEAEWDAFDEMRVRMGRKAWTDAARSKTVADLRKLAEAGYPPGDVLMQSVQRGWRGVFKIGDQSNDNQSRFGGQQRPGTGKRTVANLVHDRLAGVGG